MELHWNYSRLSNILGGRFIGRCAQEKCGDRYSGQAGTTAVINYLDIGDDQRRATYIPAINPLFALIDPVDQRRFNKFTSSKFINNIDKPLL